MIYATTRDAQKSTHFVKNGFTIVELVVVIVVIGILAAITVISYTTITNNAKSQAVATEVQKVGGELKKYKAKNGEYPIGLGDIERSGDYMYQYTSGNGSTYCLAVAQKEASFYATAESTNPKEGGCSPVAAGGLSHSVATKDGNVYTWGRGNAGQLGNGSTADSATPVAINVPGYVIGVSSGYYFSVALTAEGTIYSWGNSSDGQLGNGSTATQTTPVPVTTTGALAGKKIVSVVAGGSHTIALTSEGRVYTWGRNDNGQLGINSTTDSWVPVAVNTGVLAGKRIVAVEAGYMHSAALDAEGNVYTWGANAYGQLGNGSATDSLVPTTPVTSGVLNGKRMRQLATGYYYTLALGSDGKIYGWGRNNVGQLGNASSADVSTPVAAVSVGALANATVTSIDAGGATSGALAVGGKAYAWGYNSYGQLGTGAASSSSVPTAVSMSGALLGKRLTSLSYGDYHTFGVDTDNQFYTWGYNVYGQLGDGTTTPQLAPKSLTLPQ